jgi:hypothetical protein
MIRSPSSLPLRRGLIKPAGVRPSGESVARQFAKGTRRRLKPARAYLVAVAMTFSSIGTGQAQTVATPDGPLPTRADDDSAKLAKQLSNPVASLISVPFQSDWDSGGGVDGKGNRYVLKIEPVVPFNITPSLNLISRTILPVTTQTGITGAHRTQTGLGDVTQSLFLSPSRPLGGRLIVGVGPAVLVPTGTDRALSTGKWSVGPTFVVLTQSHGWVAGVLVNQLWSVAGNAEREHVSNMFIEPFVSFTTKKATTFSANSETSCDWKLQDRRCAMPINLTVGQLVRFGGQPISFSAGGRYYAERSAGSPKWGLRFTTTFLFPTGGR